MSTFLSKLRGAIGDIDKSTLDTICRRLKNEYPYRHGVCKAINRAVLALPGDYEQAELLMKDHIGARLFNNGYVDIPHRTWESMDIAQKTAVREARVKMLLEALK